MFISNKIYSERSWRLSGRGTRGFSLVEIVLAIGVVAFAFLAIFSLLPVGLGIFREAMDTSVSAQIVQRVVSDATETDFDQLIGNPVKGNYYAMPVRYFDDQGTEVKVGNPTAPSLAERQGPPGILYWVRVRGSLPGAANPAEHKSTYPTSLPSKGGSRFNPRDTTFLTVEVASNPTGKALDIDETSYLIDPVKAKSAGIRLQTFSVVLSRNGYPKQS
ncbi:MAG: Verru_Chthon cassette protein B [Verrucomicrobiota bacterium]